MNQTNQNDQQEISKEMHDNTRKVSTRISPREEYLHFRRQVDKYKLESGLDEIDEEALEMTREDFLALKEEDREDTNDERFEKFNRSNLPERIDELMDCFSDDMREDPVLRHLVEQRDKAARKYKTIDEDTKKRMAELTENIKQNTESLLKLKGVIESLDEQIKEFVNKK